MQGAELPGRVSRMAVRPVSLDGTALNRLA